MRLTSFRLAAIAAAAIATVNVSALFAAPITGGDIVVIRVGDGATTATGTALPVILDEYKVTYNLGGAPVGASLVQSIPLPTGAAGTAPTLGQRYLAQGGTAGGEGGLALSTNGLYMTLAGYNSGKGDTTNASGSTEDRVVGRLELSSGIVDTSTVLTGLSTGNAVRNAFTTNGNDIWVASSAQGVRYTTFGNTSGGGTGLTATNGNERRVQVYNGQLYTSRMSGTIDGVATVGTGTPTSGTQTVTLLPGMPTATNSMYDYFFADPNTLYTVDDRNGSTTTGGLEKWVFNGTSWSMAYSLLANPTGAATVGLKSLSGSVDALGNVVLFGSTTGGQGNYLYGFLDTLSNTSAANVTATPLVNSGTDFAGGSAWGVRGVAIAPLVPEPASVSMLLVGAAAVATRRRRD